MPFEVDELQEPQTSNTARDIISRIKRIKRGLQAVQTDVQGDIYTRLLANVNQFRKFDAFVQSIIDAGQASTVITEILNLYGDNGLTQQDLVGFRNAVRDLRTYIIANATEFTLSFDQGDNIVYVTPIDVAVKTSIQTQIADAIALVSADPGPADEPPV